VFTRTAGRTIKDLTMCDAQGLLEGISLTPEHTQAATDLSQRLEQLACDVEDLVHRCDDRRLTAVR
jgi:hypothetical protein